MSVYSDAVNPFPNKPCYLRICSTSLLTLSQMTNFRLFQIERVCRQQFQNWWQWQKILQMGRKQCGKKEKWLVMSNFSFSHIVYKRPVLQTRKNQGLFRKELKILWEKEKLLVTSNFSISHSVFHPFEELSIISIQFEIMVCKLLQFGRF